MVKVARPNSFVVMWKASLNRSIKELRFVLKQSPEHHGVWRFVKTQLPELRMLNQNTFFTVSEINANFKTDSACHIIYGDGASNPTARRDANII